ncbi:HpcH/HpaI aldolase/citrate lyase family protein [Gordonia rubripertincta]|uniref:CoA ester lyase n=1 Tax=Gordonia rubripertincta TaxID=36822 RepID=A0ABT4MSQ7_GORRU|nr:CoA ester lyase [Gordonia rubripertincta]MCZ4550043.1 CoA ester lyase [Gordonia rubripertincta]
MSPEDVQPRPRIDATIARSWLLVNASVRAAYMAAARSEADQVILDIEDAVDPSAKCSARDSVTDWLRGAGAWVRINDRTTPFWSEDVDHLRGASGLGGVMLAKTEYPDQVDETYDRLGGRVPVIPLIESAMGIENAVDIARRRGVLRLAFGSGDYRRDTATDADDLVMAYPRSRLVVASRVAGLTGPIDGPAVTDDEAVLRQKTATSVSFGLTGKLCLNPAHTGVVNTVISPSPEDTAWATGFLAEFEARGRVVRDGSDLPRLKRAERITELAGEFGVVPA